MPEYIEKYAAVNRLIDLENEFQQYKPFHGFEHAMYRKICEAEIAIGKIPSADVAPVRHGRWEWCKDYDGDSILVCSECGRVCHEEDAPYCYCGAKMDGGFDNG